MTINPETLKKHNPFPQTEMFSPIYPHVWVCDDVYAISCDTKDFTHILSDFDIYYNRNINVLYVKSHPDKTVTAGTIKQLRINIMDREIDEKLAKIKSLNKSIDKITKCRDELESA